MDTSEQEIHVWKSKNDSECVLVKEKRHIKLESKECQVTLPNVTDDVQMESLHIRSLTDATHKTQVTQTEFVADELANAEVKIVDSGRIIEEDDNNTKIISPDNTVHVITKSFIASTATAPKPAPALQCTFVTETPGEHDVEVVYYTEGIDWYAGYTALLNLKTMLLNLTCSVVLSNHSGKFFNKVSKLNLLDDMHNASDNAPRYKEEKKKMKPSSHTRTPKSPSVHYHNTEYTIEGTHDKPIVLPAHSSHNPFTSFTYAIVNALPVKISNRYVGGFRYNSNKPEIEATYGDTYNTTVSTIVQIFNTKEVGLGKNLPSGAIKIQTCTDQPGSLASVPSPNTISHTPVGAPFDVVLVSQVSGIVVLRKRASFTHDAKTKTMREAFDIKITNSTHNETVVDVLEMMPRWDKWEISKSSVKHTPYGGGVLFEVKALPNADTVLNYMVTYIYGDTK